MKTSMILIATVLLFTTNFINAQELTFTASTIDYGTITQGANGVRHFSFTNTGTAPLIIHNAQKSCGCTVPTWPKEPILPGESAKITVKYDTNRLGAFSKYVTITSNDINAASTKLQIKGMIEKEAAATPEKEATVFK